MGNKDSFFLELIWLNIHFFRFVLNIVWYNSNILSQFTDNTIENIHRDCYEILSAETGRSEKSINLDEVPASNISTMIQTRQDNREDMKQNENLLYSYCSDFIIPPVSLECPQNIFEDSNSELEISRKRKDSCNSAIGFNSSNTPNYDFTNNINHCNKKSKTNLNKGEMVQSEHECHEETSFKESVYINTNESSNIACIVESSHFLNNPQTTYSVKNLILDAQEHTGKLKDDQNTEVITQTDSSKNSPKCVLENRNVTSMNTEPIERETHNIRGYRHKNSSNTSVNSSHLPDCVVFIPYIGDRKHIILPNDNLISDRKFPIVYRRIGSDEGEYMTERGVSENSHRPEITILNGFNDDKGHKIIFVIKNFPKYFKPIFSKKLTTMEKISLRVTQYGVFLYTIHMTITCSGEDTLKMIDLVPYIAYEHCENIWKDNYVDTILNRRYKIANTCDNNKHINSDPGTSVDMSIEKKYLTKSLRHFLGLRNFQNKYFKELSSISTPSIIQILNKLSIFHTHLIYLNALYYTPDRLTTVINKIDNVSKQFLTGILQIEKGSVLTDTENEIISVYETLYSNFEQLSDSILNSYKLYV